ncbi:MAG: hypothetical protein ABFD76_17120 [Smithella sp.]
MEPVVSYEPLAKEKGSSCDTRDHRTCRIHIHHKRKRIADPDGISIKAAIDGLVLVGLLADDNAKIINQTSQSQEKSKHEETIIDIVWE